MAFWNPEKIRFMEDASAHVPFSDMLAAEASAYFDRDALVCDAGCGLGFLSIALAKHCRQVISADCDDEVLNVLRKHIAQKRVSNVAPLCCDIFSHTPNENYDAMVFCFFASIAETLACAKGQCSGNVIMFKKDWHSHRFSITETPIEKIRHNDSEAELSALGIPYISKSFSVDMGQPFRSLNDAVAFFRLYERGDRTDFDLKKIESMLVPGNSAEFPYYLPAVRNVGMIVINTADIPAPEVLNEYNF